MALKDWKKIHEGMESPAWYNIVFKNKKNKREIILSNSGKHEGSNVANDEWTMGTYTSNNEPIDQKQFSHKSKALAYAKQYMRTH